MRGATFAVVSLLFATGCPPPDPGEDAGPPVDPECIPDLAYDEWSMGEPADLAPASGGFALLDFDDDGDLDVFVPRGFTFWFRFQFTEDYWAPLLLRNDGDTFTDVSAAAGLTRAGLYATAATGDFDGDGLDDIFAPDTDPRDGENTADSPDFVYMNNGDGTFREIALDEPSGVTLAVCTADFDNDGTLDLFLANEQDRDIPIADADGNPGIGGQGDELYRGNGDGTFTRVTDQTLDLADRPNRWSDACAAWDYDDDGDVDLLVAEKYGGVLVFRNDGNLQFANVTQEVLGPLGDAFGQWMGFAIADYDLDGDEDVFVTNWGTAAYGDNPSRLVGEDGVYLFHAMLRNDGGTFTDVAPDATLKCWPGPGETWGELPPEASGLARLEFGWGAAPGDADLDGRPDLFFAGALAFNPVFQIIGTFATGANPGRLLLNRPDDEWIDVAARAGIENVDSTGFILDSMGALLADLDGDGSLEAIIGNQWFGEEDYPGGVRVWSPGDVSGNWIGLRLRGTNSNPNGIGARIAVVTDARTRNTSAWTSSAFGTNAPGRVHVGLGDESVSSVVVRWPSGAEQTLDAPAMNQWLEVREPQ